MIAHRNALHLRTLPFVIVPWLSGAAFAQETGAPARLVHGDEIHDMILRGDCPEAQDAPINLWAFVPGEEEEPDRDAPRIHLTGDGQWSRVEVTDASFARIVNDYSDSGPVFTFDGSTISWSGNDISGREMTLEVTCPG